MSKEYNGTTYYTYKESAEKLCLQSGTIAVMVKRKIFQPIKFNGDARKYISASQLEAYQSNLPAETTNSPVTGHDILQRNVTTQHTATSNVQEPNTINNYVNLVIPENASQDTVQAIIQNMSNMLFKDKNVEFSLVWRCL